MKSTVKKELVKMLNDLLDRESIDIKDRSKIFSYAYTQARNANKTENK